MKSTYKVIGLMSGTSLDGLDITYCVFRKLKSGWKYDISKYTTVKYPARWLDRLSKAHLLTGEELMDLDAAYGIYLGEKTRDFIQKHNLRVDFVSSHGHTVFHQPPKGFTFQIGNGYSLFASGGVPVVCDFRRLDVALGGEGAPLVPAGDHFLFTEYDVCLNMGGIANLSTVLKGKRRAFDICFCNTPLNYLSARMSKTYDKNGEVAASGTVNAGLMKRLQAYYSRIRIKRPSLGREIFAKEIQPLLDQKNIPLEDLLSTLTESAAIEITSAILSVHGTAKVLCTGGGAFNAFLISRMLHYGGDDLTFIIPDEEIVKFKEALVFGFLGVLKVRGEVNCLKSVTNAARDSSSGTMIGF